MQFEYMCCLLGGPVTLEMLKALLKANAGKWMRQHTAPTVTVQRKSASLEASAIALGVSLSSASGGSK